MPTLVREGGTTTPLVDLPLHVVLVSFVITATKSCSQFLLRMEFHLFWSHPWMVELILWKCYWITELESPPRIRLFFAISIFCWICVYTFQDGIAPIHLASQRGDTDLVKSFIEHGADIDVQVSCAVLTVYSKSSHLIYHRHQVLLPQVDHNCKVESTYYIKEV